MSKPSWSEAPRWANWLAQDGDGSWFWYENRPMDRSGDSIGSSWWWDNSGRDEVYPAPGWRETLEARPQFIENKNPASLPQLPPLPGGDIVITTLVRDIIARAEAGRIKYGRYLETNNGRDALLDLYQEQLDAAAYTCQLLMEKGVILPSDPDQVHHTEPDDGI